MNHSGRMLARCLSRRLASPVLATSSYVITTAQSSGVSLRSFSWNPFAKTSAADKVSTQHARIVDKAHRDANLHNERMLDVCLDLLDMCGASPTSAVTGAQNSGKPTTVVVALSDSEREVIVKLTNTLLHNFRCSPRDQFDLVYTALCLPVTRNNLSVHRSLMVVLESVVPLPLYRLFESVDLIISGDNMEALERREVLCNFVHAMLGSIHAPRGVEDEELLMVYLDDFKQTFPVLVGCPAFVELEKDATAIALKAKLFVLLGQLCAEFDKDNTGKVLLLELRATAERTLGKQQAAMLLEGAQTDEEGKIFYPQLVALLTRPPPRRD